MDRAIRVMVHVVSCIALYCSAIHAQVNTNGELGVVRTLSAKTMGKTTMNIGAGVNFAQSSDYISGPVINGALSQPIPDTANKKDTIKTYDAGKMLSANAFLAFGLTDFWDLATSVPFYYDWAGFNDIHDGGIGDIEISTKFSFPGSTEQVFYQSYLVAGTLPVGMKDNGLFPRHPYFLANRDTNPAETFYSSKYFTVKGMLLWTFDIRSATQNKLPLQIDLNIGGVICASRKNQNNTTVESIAMEYMPADFLTMFVDFHSESRWSDISANLDPSNDPMILTPGIRITAPTGLYLFIAGDFSFSSNAVSARRDWIIKNYFYSTGVIPRYGAEFAIGWNGPLTVHNEYKDSHKNDEYCVSDAGNLDETRDADGCPDLFARASGVPNLKAATTKESERGEWAPDLSDQCPDVAGNSGGYEDQNGCPELNNGEAGKAESIDRCHNAGGDSDAGCPDPWYARNTQAGIGERCSGESAGNDEGCPDTVVRKEIDFPKSQILKNVSFRPSSADITFNSYQFLDPIALAMKRYPEIRIDIQAYTDAIGDQASNVRLTQMRAEAVRQYLLSRDISMERVHATGMGSANPIADNKTAAGRAQNRRIEIHRTN